MSLQTVPMILSSINTTVYRNWIKAMSDALTAIGVTKTADTGQVNLTPTTLALPTAAQGLTQSNGAFNFYEIRQLVSAGKPTIYLKVRYGVYYNNQGTGANYYWPAISIEPGSATDGAGNITPFDAGGSRYGLMTTNDMSGSLSSGSGRPAATTQNCYFASDGANYLNLVIGTNSPAFEVHALAVMGIERTNTPGAATFTFNGNGLVMWTGMSSLFDSTTTASGAVPAPGGLSTYTYTLQDFNTQQTVTGGTIPAQTPPFVYRPNVSTDCSIYPVTVGVNHGPLLGVVGYDANLLIENTQFAANVYNATRNYVAVVRTSRYADPFNTAFFGVRID